MRTAPVDEHEARFWAEAEPLLARAGVTESTMMGLPCLRIHGAFFASFDRRTGALLVKLPETTVDELVAAGRAESFAPAGRRFREWAAIAAADVEAWESYLVQAHEHVAHLDPTVKPRPRQPRHG